jgi:hypothetical protein
MRGRRDAGCASAGNVQMTRPTTIQNPWHEICLTSTRTGDATHPKREVVATALDFRSSGGVKSICPERTRGPTSPAKHRNRARDGRCVGCSVASSDGRAFAADAADFRRFVCRMGAVPLPRCLHRQW